jgi:hypothetical protein
MCRHAFVALTLVSCAFLAACGGSSMNTPPTVNGAPMSLAIRDTPPSGVAVLFFEALITGGSLQPSDMSKAAVPVVTTPVEVEFGHLQTDTAFLSLTNIPADTYKSLTLTFGSAVLTIANHSGAAIGSCANNAVCQITPNFNPSTATLSSPFPITVDANSTFGIKLDFNVNASLQSDLSVNPMVSVVNVTHRRREDDQGDMEKAEDVDGQVTAVGTNMFTLMNERSGQSFTVNVDSNTAFQDFDRAGCTASPQNFSCVMMGEIVEVDLSESGTGTMLAKRVKLEEQANQGVLKATITTVDSSTQFHAVVFNQEPALSGVSEGGAVVVTILPSATFEASNQEMGEDGGFTQTGLSFASAADLLVGQDVQVRPQTVTSAGGVTTITSDRIRLRPSQITGQVGTINSDGTFMLTGLSPLFAGATPAITSIKVEMVSKMSFEDVSGLSGLAVGNTVSVKGLLFNTSGLPTLLAKGIRKQ